MSGRGAAAVAPRRVLAGGVPAVQADATSCGAASVLVARGMLDPAVGRRLREDPGRFADAQARVRAATARGALGPLNWPLALGTPPWTAARTLSTDTVRYRPVWLRGRDLAGGGIERVAAEVAALTARGLPVPIYVGHPLLARRPFAGTLDNLPAVPRHVILAVPNAGVGSGMGAAGSGAHGEGDAGASSPVDTALDVYEPGGGLVHRVTARELRGLAVAPDDPALLPARRALGGWTRLCVVLRPRVAPDESHAAGWDTEGPGYRTPAPGTPGRKEEA